MIRFFILSAAAIFLFQQAAMARTWDIILQIEGLPTPSPKVDFLEIDGFDASAEQVAAIKAQGTQAICYISAGTAEDFRPDFDEFKKIPDTVGKGFPGFAGDYFLNIHHWKNFFPVMERRISMCKEKGFDYVDFDVIDSYDVDSHETGFQGNEATQIEYIVALTRKAHEIGLKTVQKNAGELAPKLEPHFDAILFEECVRLDFCADAAPYVAAGKPVFNVEYHKGRGAGKAFKKDACDISAKHKVLTIFSTLDLDQPATGRCE